MSCHYEDMTKMENTILGFINWGILCGSDKVILPRYRAWARSSLVYIHFSEAAEKRKGSEKKYKND